MNLDATINRVGFEIARLLDDKNLIEKLLGVLANDGVYAMWVYALNKVEEEEKLLGLLLQLSSFPIQVKGEENNIIKLENIQRQIELFECINKLKKEIKDLKLKRDENNKAKKDKLDKKKKELNSKKEEYKTSFQKNYDFFKALSTDLNQLLFFKELIEKTLIYARYHAKAIGNE